MKRPDSYISQDFTLDVSCRHSIKKSYHSSDSLVTSERSRSFSSPDEEVGTDGAVGSPLRRLRDKDLSAGHHPARTVGILQQFQLKQLRLDEDLSATRDFDEIVNLIC